MNFVFLVAVSLLFEVLTAAPISYLLFEVGDWKIRLKESIWNSLKPSQDLCETSLKWKINKFCVKQL